MSEIVDLLERVETGPTCKACDGTGIWLLMKSWFLSDGFTSCRCHICKGTGVSDYRPDASLIAGQRRLRSLKDASS